MRHHPDVEHVRVREDHVRASANVASLLRRCVAVVDRDPEARQPECRERAGLVLRERLRRIEQERPGVWVAGDRVEHGKREGKRLARGGRRRDHCIPARGGNVPQLGLMRPEPGDPAPVERFGDGRRDSGIGDARPRAGGRDRAMDDLRGRGDKRLPGCVESLRTPRDRARTPRRTGVVAARRARVARGSPSVNTIVVGIESTP